MDIQITFRDFESSAPIRAYVEKRAAKTLAPFERVVSTRVVLAKPHHHHRHGSHYHVTVDVVLPRDHVVASPRDGVTGHADLYAAIDEAFDVLDRQLHAHALKRAQVE